LLEITDYSTLVSISQDIHSKAFIENLQVVTYICTNPRLSMRIHQDKYSNILRKKISDLTDKGEFTLYIITGSCIVIVLVSIALTFPVFIWVIKDKSYVLSIFADIKDEEIKSIIESAMNFDIRTVQYRKKWVLSNANDEEKFWKICLKGNKDHEDEKNDKNAVKVTDGEILNKDSLNQSSSLMRIENSTNLNSNTNGVPKYPSILNMKKYKEIKIDNAKLNSVQSKETEKNLRDLTTGKPYETSKFNKIQESDMQDEEDEPKPENFKDEVIISPEELALREEKKRKLTSKRAILSKLDTSLRNTAIFRLIIILSVFMLYSGISLYFNWFIHDFSRTSIRHFYDLLKRSLHVPTINMLIRMAITEKNYQYVSRNLSIFNK